MDNNTSHQIKDSGLGHKYTKDSGNQGNRDILVEKHECSAQGLMSIHTSSKIKKASNHDKAFRYLECFFKKHLVIPKNSKKLEIAIDVNRLKNRIEWHWLDEFGTSQISINFRAIFFIELYLNEILVGQSEFPLVQYQLESSNPQGEQKNSRMGLPGRQCLQFDSEHDFPLGQSITIRYGVACQHEIFVDDVTIQYSGINLKNRIESISTNLL